MSNLKEMLIRPKRCVSTSNKKKNSILLITLLSIFMVACSSQNALDGEASITEQHEHIYAEEITMDATCETDGEKTFICECGDTYTEVITAKGHNFVEYVSNGDATYLADGTETATCVCGLVDTRVAKGSKLTYTCTNMSATMYAQKSVNVRNMPSSEGEQLGALKTNDKVTVMGKCNETGWYQIVYNDRIGYVSNDYLGENKVVVNNSTNSGTTSRGGGTLTITDSDGTHVYTEEEAIAMGFIPSPEGGYTLNLVPGMAGDGGPLTGNVMLNP